MFHWFRNRRRRQLLRQPFSEAWLKILEKLPHYAAAPEATQTKLRDLVRIFIAEKSWEGCRGLAVSQEMQVVIAGLACLLVAGLDDFCFENVQTVLLYPAAYKAREKKKLPDGSIREGYSGRLGETEYRGPVILSWADIQKDLERAWHGRNLVFHEFAHQLDMLNGEADGVPVLPPGLEKPWQSVLFKEYKRLGKLADHGIDNTLIDPYGATNPAEFFAVISESFFDSPVELKREHSKLYEVLSQYYRQDPAQWFRGDDHADA